MSSLDPITMATQLATFDVQAFQQRYQMQADLYQAQLTAMGKVESALRDFRNAINEMNGVGSSIVQNSVSTSQEGFFSASAGASALGGSYQIFVEQVASAHQVSTTLGDITAETEIPTTGELKFTVNGESMTLDLSTVDKNGDSKATVADLVNAINNDSTNPGVNATLVRTDGKTHLMLSSTETGEANRINVSASGTGAAWFEDGFNTTTSINEPKDAVIWLGAKDSGLKLTNASNTFEGVIDGVDITVTKAQDAGDAPISMTVGPDSEATKEQVTEFVDAYNTLMGTLEEYTSLGGGEGEERGALASDPTLRSIKSQLNTLVRSDFNGMMMSEIGLSIDREGKMTLDDKKFSEAQKNGGASIEKLFNGEGNLLDSIDTMMDPYLKYGSGIFSSRKETLQGNLDRIDDKQAVLDRKYEMSYDRYLKQFTQMNQIMTQMNQTMGMFG